MDERRSKSDIFSFGMCALEIAALEIQGNGDSGTPVSSDPVWGGGVYRGGGRGLSVVWRSLQRRSKWYTAHPADGARMSNAGLIAIVVFGWKCRLRPE